MTADLLGREVLVMLLNGKPRAFVNVCVHHGGRSWTTTYSGASGTAPRSTRGRVERFRDRCGPDTRLMMLPTRVEDGVLTYVYDE